MKKYRLLKDLPGIPAGVTLTKGYTVFYLPPKSNVDSVTTFYDADKFPEWFEEIKEEGKCTCAEAGYGYCMQDELGACCCYKNPDCPTCPKVQPTEKEEWYGGRKIHGPQFEPVQKEECKHELRLIDSTTLQWPNGDTLEWTGSKFLFNEAVKPKGPCTCSKNEACSACPDFFNKAKAALDTAFNSMQELIRLEGELSELKIKKAKLELPGRTL